MPKRVFVRFESDKDRLLQGFLIRQATNPDSPFEGDDCSIKEASPEWKIRAQARTQAADTVIVLSGEYMDQAVGVASELAIAQQQEAVDCLLLNGYHERTGKNLTIAKSADKVYEQTWRNLKSLIGGGG
ncbi:hypothetical protein [Streptomyces cyaneofuscatus]|uniref:hypothetical protein n=1 Tax=Streptomyces cyaneofuscatus TaxID=66883 RepID=UPI0036C6D237